MILLAGGAFGAAASFGTPNILQLKGPVGSIANRIFNSSLTGAGFGAAYAGMTGWDIGSGATMGALGWAAGEGANMLIGNGIGFMGQGLFGAGWKAPAYYNGAFFYEGNPLGALSIGNVVWGYKGISHVTVNHEVAGHAKHQGILLGPSYLPAHIVDKITFTNALKYSSAALGGAPTYFDLFPADKRPWTWWGARRY